MRFSIKKKLIAFIFLLLLSADGFVMWYFPGQQERQYLHTFEERGKALCQTLALAVGIGLSNEDYGSMTTAFGFARQGESTAYIAILDSEGETLAAFPDELTPGQLETIGAAVTSGTFRGQGLTVYSYPILVDERPFGYAVLAESLDQLHKDISRSRYEIFEIALVMLVLASVVTYAIASMISRPIVRLTRATQSIANGELSTQVDITSKDEVGTLGERFNQMARTLAATMGEVEEQRQAAIAANELKSHFLANVSHELRTPMNPIIGMTALMLDSTLTPEQRRHLEVVQESADYLLVLVNDILDLSKIEAGELSLEAIPFNLREDLLGSIKGLTLKAEEDDLDLIFRTAPTVPDRVVGDPVRLRQVIVNLAGNAIKFTGHGQVFLNVETDDSGESIRLSVSDTGIGIAADKQERIFDAFAQADSSTTRQYGGTGLGLAISSQLVEIMGGRLHVDSTPGKGSTFSFSIQLPAADPSHTTGAARAPEMPRELRVLIVDDNATQRAIVEELFAHWGALPTAVADAGAGLDALARVRRRECPPFDLLVIDDDMPRMDGFEMAACVGPEGPPVVLLTRISQRGINERCADLGIAAYSFKPFDDAALQYAALRALRGESRAPLAEERGDVSQQGEPLPCHILVAEDNVANQQLALAILEKHNHLVQIANNGAEALELMARDTFDLALMDVQMPTMDGYEATRRVRERERATGGHIPIIALTAHAMRKDEVRCIEAGMDSYLTKPFTPQQLLHAVAQTQEGKAAPSDSVEAGGFSRTQALSHVENDEALLAGMVDFILESYPDLLAAVGDALERKDAAELEKNAHALKGTLSVLGTNPAFAAAQALEQAARMGDEEAMTADYANLTERLSVFTGHLAGLVGAQRPRA